MGKLFIFFLLAALSWTSFASTICASCLTQGQKVFEEQHCHSQEMPEKSSSSSEQEQHCCSLCLLCHQSVMLKALPTLAVFSSDHVIFSFPSNVLEHSYRPSTPPPQSVALFFFC